MMASTNRAPLVRLTRASKSWFAGDQRIQILQRIEVNVFMGASLAIMGPSGAGKSTLLHILGLLTPIDAGTLEFAGQRIDNSTNCWKSTLRSQIGLIFQDAKLIPELTVMGNVCVPLVHRGFWPASQKKLALEALSRVGLADRIDHKPNQLSGGELMRAAIARAIVQRPRLLLADEPTGNLDSTTGARITELLMDMVSPTRALVYVTHNQDVAKYADHLIIIKDGKIVSHN